MEHRSSRLPDTARYSRRLWRYLLEFEAISEALKGMELQSIDRLDFDRILETLLPELCKASNSEGAFYADRQGEIRFAKPEDSTLVGKTLPSSKYIDRLIEVGKPLVIVGGTDADPDPILNKLDVESLLLARLVVPWDTYIIGVYNGQDDLIYTGEDQKFLTTLLEIFGFGLCYGHHAQREKQRAEQREETENKLTYERFLDARLLGEYSILHRDGRDYAQRLLKLGSDTAKLQFDTLFDADEVYADYLDAMLSIVIHDESGLEKVTTDIMIPKESELFSSLSQLPTEEFPQTALSIARIFLWADFKNCSIMADWLGEQAGNGNSQQENLDKLSSFTKLLEEVESKKIQAEELPPLQPYLDWLKTPPKTDQVKMPREELSGIKLYMDWLRTNWQKIYYLAWNGRSEPRREWVEKITFTYKLVRSRTVWMLQAYLYAHEDEEGISVNSDWLITYLTSNVLMSRAITEYYALDKIGKEGIASPAETIDHFAHLSHLILYALHCIRHLHREKEIPEERKREATVRQPPFAEVPVDISLSLSESQLHVLSEYAYHEIGVHRELVLLERLTRQLRYELPLYAASEFYRDHLYHVIDVCLLGELLLRSRVIPRATTAPSLTLVEIFSEKLSRKNSPASSVDDKRKQTKSLLKNWREKLSKNSSPVSSVDDRRKQTRLLLKNWYVAALCHDLGYVVERAGNLLEPVHAIKGPGLEEFWDTVEAGLELGRAEIDRVVKSKLPRSLDGTGLLYDLKRVEPTDHGIAGWLHLSHCLAEVKDSPGQKDLLEQMEHALNAIVRHNLPKQQVSCSDEPLTFLLMLCDHLQEWGRPRVGPDPLARGVMEALRFSKQPSFDQKVRVEGLFIKGLTTIPPERPDVNSEICEECWETEKCQQHCLRLHTQIKEKRGIEFVLKHTEARAGDFEPAISWLLMCRDLQCFGGQEDSLPFDFDLKIRMEHPPSRIWDEFSWKPLEMDLIQEFASNYEQAAYLCQWAEKAHKHEDGIEYDKRRETGFEAFTIHLNKLAPPLPQGFPSDHRKKFYTWKWQRLRQQYIDLSLGSWFPES